MSQSVTAGVTFREPAAGPSHNHSICRDRLLARLLLRYGSGPNRDVLEGRMRRSMLGCLTMIVLTLAGCGSIDNNYTVQRLLSGREVKIIGIGKVFFSKGDPALMLKYRTDLRLDDREQVRKEVEEIWQVFRVDVERAGMKAAIISVQEPGKQMLIVSTSKSYNFVIQKSEAGTWEFLDDRAPRRQAG